MSHTYGEPVHSCHAQCECHSGGKPVPDFIEGTGIIAELTRTGITAEPEPLSLDALLRTWDALNKPPKPFVVPRAERLAVGDVIELFRDGGAGVWTEATVAALDPLKVRYRDGTEEQR